MVFSSVPLYLDPPNWQQHTNDNQHHHHQQIQNSSAVGSGNEIQHHHLIIPSQQPVAAQQFGPHVQPHQVGLGVPPVRPNSMAERARALKIPPPENPLKCPRCESTNTKFCYYNNYSLTQPRHFCKTCRRYWTRGGALRNVPVGGGCRRNKRSSSKSSGGGATSSSSTKSSLSSPTVTAVGGGHMDVLSSTIMGPTITGIPSGGGGMTSFMASLQQNMANIGMGNIGLNFGGGIIHGPHGAHHSLGVGGLHHHHHHRHPEIDFNNDQLMMSQQQQPQFPNNLLGGFEVGGGGSSGGGSLYNSTFQGDHHQGVIGSGGDDGDDDEHHHHEVNDVNMNVNIPSKSCSSPAMMMSQLAPVKMEEGGQGLSLAKQLMMGISSSSSDNANGGGGGGGNQFWSFPIPNANTIGATTGMWTDLSGLNSSSMN